MIRLYLWYATAVASIGVVPYLGPLLERSGYTPSQVTVLLLILPIANLSSAPLASLLTDRIGRHRPVLATTMTTAGLLLLSMTLVPPTWLALVLVGFALAKAPTFPIADAASTRALGDGYGPVRAVGSLGYALLVFGCGVLRETWPDAPVVLVGVLLLLSALNIGAIPVLEEPPSPSLAIWRGFVGRPATLLVLAVAFLNGLSLSVYDYLFTLSMDARGLEGWVTGAAIALGVLVEVSVLFASRVLLRRFGVKGLMVVGVGVAIPRFLGTAWIDDPVLLVGLQGLHGLQFGCFWLAGLAWIEAFAPAGARRSSQAAFSAAGFGLAPIVALLSASVWLQAADLRSLYGLAVIPAVLATVLALAIPERPARA